MPAGLLASREAQEAGRDIFAVNCAICHGANGDGRGLRREGMIPPPADLTRSVWSGEAGAAKTYRVIQDGVPGSAMPSWPTLSEQQIWNLVAYIHSLKGR